MSALTQAPGSAGSAAMRDSIAMTVRHVRALLREPAWIAITLTTPVIWLLLFGSLFERAVDIPGFGSGDYTDFFTPGVVVMTAFFSAGWSGMSNRFLGPPVKRSALIVGRVGQAAITIAIQSLIIVALALIVGANFANGVLGMVAIGALLGSPWAPCPTDWRWSCARTRR